MLLIAFFIALIFFSLGFIVTKDNATYVLSGYNTMSEADRSTVDIETYLKFFKRFHIYLGLSLFTGVALLDQINKNWASFFMILYPILAYTYFAFKGLKFFNSVSTKKMTGKYILTGGILLLTVVLIIRQGFLDFRSSEIIFYKDELEIAGSYGLKLKRQDIRKQELVNELPAISFRSNGFSGGNYSKGSFRLKDGRTVKLFINTTISPTLLLHTAKGTIYYSTDETEMRQLDKKIRQWREQ